MDAVGSVVLVAVTAAIGIGALVALVQLWRRQPVYEDDLVGQVEDDQDDEDTVALADTLEQDGDDEESDTPTRVLHRRG